MILYIPVLQMQLIAFVESSRQEDDPARAANTIMASLDLGGYGEYCRIYRP